MNKTAKKNTEDFLGICYAVVLCYFVYSIVQNQLSYILSDYNGHLYVYYPLFSKEFFIEAWQTVPYFLWHGVVFILENLFHIPIENAAGYTSCFFAVFSYGVIRWVFLKIFEGIDGDSSNSQKASTLAFCLSIVQGIYVDFFDIEGRYLGIFSMNPLHNPTQMCVLGIAVLCMVLTYDIVCMQKKKDYNGIFFHVEKNPKRYYILLAILLLLSTLAKPTFAEMFILAVGIFMLGELCSCTFKDRKQGKKYFKHCFHMFLCSIPALMYILLQSIDYFVMGGSYSGETSVIFTGCGEVWSIFSENIILSIVLGMAFPLYVFLLHPAFFLKTNLGKLGIISYLVGLMEALFLAESGIKFTHANFMWPMCSGMAMMWLVSVIEMVMLEKQAVSKRKNILVQIGWFIFAAHVLCGYLYIKELLI